MVLGRIAASTINFFHNDAGDSGARVYSPVGLRDQCPAITGLGHGGEETFRKEAVPILLSPIIQTEIPHDAVNCGTDRL